MGRELANPRRAIAAHAGQLPGIPFDRGVRWRMGRYGAEVDGALLLAAGLAEGGQYKCTEWQAVVPYAGKIQS